MGDFHAFGTLIDRNLAYATGLGIQLQGHHRLAEHVETLGAATSDADGKFSIHYPDPSAHTLWSKLEGAVMLHLAIVGPRGEPLLATREVAAAPEIQYHIRLATNPPDPGAPNLYADGLRRMITGIEDADISDPFGVATARTRGRTGRLVDVVRRRQRALNQGSEIRVDRIDHGLAYLEGVVAYEEEQLHLSRLGYDGPQVPANAWPVADVQVVIWPRSGAFRWA